MRDYKFTVVLEKDEDGRFVVTCPALQGCYTEGETEDEALENIREAIQAHVESRLKAGEPVYEEFGSRVISIAV